MIFNLINMILNYEKKIGGPIFGSSIWLSHAFDLHYDLKKSHFFGHIPFEKKSPFRCSLMRWFKVRFIGVLSGYMGHVFIPDQSYFNVDYGYLIENPEF